MKVARAAHRSLPAPAVEPDLDEAADLPVEMTDKHHELIEALVFGTDDPRVEALTRSVVKIVGGERVPVDRPLRKGEPLTLSEAAQLLGFRQRHARRLMAAPVMHRAYTAELHRLREGGKPRAMAEILALVEREGQDKAADAKVRLQAAQAILGEAVGTPSSRVSVNTYVGGTTITPGYVIRIPAKPGEDRHTIDHGAAGAIVFDGDEGGDE